MKNNLLLCALFYLFLSSCNQGKKEAVNIDQPDKKQSSLEIFDKGLDTLFIDETVNFQVLTNLKLTKIGNQEYLSHFYRRTSTIYVHDLESGKIILFNKITLEKEGPNKVTFSLLINYFIHRPDSIFIDTYKNIYYLVNNKGEVIKRIGRSSEDSNDNFFQFL